jgi:hypothetical protein
MSLDVTIKGASALVGRMRRMAAETPEVCGDALEARTETEIRSREKVSSSRLPLDIGRADVLETRVAWPYPHEGGEGTYITQIMTEAAQLLGQGLERDLRRAVEGAGQ